MCRLKVGFVKKYFSEKEHGYIRNVRVLQPRSSIIEENLFFHISNTNQELFKPGDIVGFISKNDQLLMEDFTLDKFMELNDKEDEALNVKLVKDYTEELQSMKLADFEKALVFKGNSTLLLEEMNSDSDGKVKLFNNIDQHVESTDIDLLIDNYSVEVKGFGAFRTRKDETARICIVSRWNEINDSSPLYDHSKHAAYYHNAGEKYRNDAYINDLFPTINIEVYKETGFCSWQTIVRRYKKDKKNWAELEQRASKKEAQIKRRARNTYNKKDHKTILHCSLKDEVTKFKKEFNSKINKAVNKYWNYTKHTKNHK